MCNSDELIERYRQYLLLEQNLSPNSIEAYTNDVQKLFKIMDEDGVELSQVDRPYLHNVVAQLYDLGVCSRTVARIISGIKSFYKFLLDDNIVDEDPSELLETPKIGFYLPEVLTVEQIDAIINAVPHNTPHTYRDKAIIEMLYSCGLRVSELCDLQMQNLHLDETYIKVYGKGRKERLIPMSPPAIKAVSRYLNSDERVTPKRGHENYLFISRLGKKLSRISIFTLVKKLAEQAGVEKNISPHTFRHSFATHLLEGGAHLQAIQLLLGHEDIATTAIYTHMDKTQLREVILKYHSRNSEDSK